MPDAVATQACAWPLVISVVIASLGPVLSDRSVGRLVAGILGPETTKAGVHRLCANARAVAIVEGCDDSSIAPLAHLAQIRPEISPPEAFGLGR